MPRMRLIAMSAITGLTAAVGAAVMIAAPGAASGAVLGAAQPAAPAITAISNELFGVSCPAVKQCVAVGHNQNAYGGKGGPLAETWNGKSWHAATLPLPAGGVSGELSAVSCPTTKKCVAVGQYSGGLLAETWNGKSWTPTALPGIKGAGGVNLTGVSCATTTSCVAVGVGGYSSSSTAVAAIWNGGKWAVTAVMPTGLNAIFGDLDAVSCTSAKNCLAVGSWSSDTNGATLAEAWNGTAWKTLPAPAGFALTGVSCKSATYCVAVGNTGDVLGPPEPLAGFADVWNGKKWSALKLPWPKSGNSYLMGVSCAKTGSCATAGGQDINLRAVPHTGKAAAATLNGKTWTIAKLPALRAGRASLFDAVSCPSASYCVAVGHYGPNKTRLGAGWSGVWNGKSWKLMTAI